MLLDDLRRRVRRRPTNSPSKLSEVSSAAKAKIYKFHIPILIEHDILRFDIPMAEPALLKIQQSCKDLVEYPRSFLLRHGPCAIDHVEQFSVPAVLHEDIDLVLLLYHLVYLGNIFME